MHGWDHYLYGRWRCGTHLAEITPFGIDEMITTSQAPGPGLHTHSKIKASTYTLCAYLTAANETVGLTWSEAWRHITTFGPPVRIEYSNWLLLNKSWPPSRYSESIEWSSWIEPYLSSYFSCLTIQKFKCSRRSRVNVQLPSSIITKEDPHHVRPLISCDLRIKDYIIQVYC